MIRLWLGIALTFSLQPNIMYTSILTYQRFLWALKAELLAIGVTIVPGHLVPWSDACWPRRKANSFLWIYCSVSSSSPPPKGGLGILSAPLGILGKAPGMDLASLSMTFQVGQGTDIAARGGGASPVGSRAMKPEVFSHWLWPGSEQADHQDPCAIRIHKAILITCWTLQVSVCCPCWIQETQEKKDGKDSEECRKEEPVMVVFPDPEISEGVEEEEYPSPRREDWGKGRSREGLGSEDLSDAYPHEFQECWGSYPHSPGDDPN